MKRREDRWRAAARALVRSDSKALAARRARYGSVANDARWSMVRDTVRWCALTLGVHRCRLVLNGSKQRSRERLRMLLVGFSYAETMGESAPTSVPEHSASLASAALHLLRLSVPAADLHTMVERAASGSGGDAPWIVPWADNIRLSAEMDAVIDERKGARDG